jgi:hypothetical protein
MFDGLRNHARVMNIRNILVSHVYHVLWVFDYTTIRAVDIRGNRDLITWGNVFYICGSAQITAPTQSNTGDCVKDTGDCVKDSGARFLRASETAGEAFINYIDVYAPMAESADGMYLYISTGEPSQVYRWVMSISIATEGESNRPLGLLGGSHGLWGRFVV